MGWRLRWKMYNHRWIKILFKITDDQIDIFHGRPDNINDGDAMNLLSLMVDVKVKRDIVLSEILEFHKGGDNVKIGLVEDDYFPDVFLFVEYLFIQLFLLLDQIHFNLRWVLHIFYLGSIDRKCV